MAAVIELIVRVVQEGKVLSEGKRIVDPTWNFEFLKLTPYEMLALTERDIKANMAKPLVAELQSKVGDVTVDALLELELALKESKRLDTQQESEEP